MIAKLPDQALVALDTQVKRGHLFIHTALGENAARLAQLQALLHGLADALIANGRITSDELGEAVSRADAELRARGEQLGPGIRIRVDNDEAAAEPEATVDCGSRLPVCKAVCCRLNFALSVDEIEAGQVLWDLGVPYFVRRHADGRCVHQDADAKCMVYADRPRVCRRYDCTHDARIWTDFAGRVLNTEWIAAHLGESARPCAEAVEMHFFPPAKAAPTAPDDGDALSLTLKGDLK